MSSQQTSSHQWVQQQHLQQQMQQQQQQQQMLQQQQQHTIQGAVHSTVTGQAVPPFVHSQPQHQEVETTRVVTTTTTTGAQQIQQEPTYTTTTTGTHLIHQEPTYATGYSIEGYQTSMSGMPTYGTSTSYPAGVTTYPGNVETTYHTTEYPKQTTVTTETTEHHITTAEGQSVGRQVTSGQTVLRRERGEQRLVSVTETVDKDRSQVLNERYEEKEIRIPKRIVREETYEKVYVVPEKHLVTEDIEETVMVQEKIIEIAVPTVVKKVIEIPEIEWVEKIVEVPYPEKRTKVVQQTREVLVEKITEVPKPKIIEKVVEVPGPIKEVIKQRVVPVYEDVVETVYDYVEIPQVREKVKYVPVDDITYIDVNRKLPVPVESEVTYEYRIPRLKPKYAKVAYPVYLPRFVEVPVAAELLTPDMAREAEAYLARVGTLTTQTASLCDVENLAATIKNSKLQEKISESDLPSAVLNAWHSGSLTMPPDVQQHQHQHHQHTTTTTTRETMVERPVESAFQTRERSQYQPGTTTTTTYQTSVPQTTYQSQPQTTTTYVTQPTSTTTHVIHQAPPVPAM